MKSIYKKDETPAKNHSKVPERVTNEPMLFEQLRKFSDVSNDQRAGNEYIVNQMVNYYAFEAQMKDRVIDLLKPVMVK